MATVTITCSVCLNDVTVDPRAAASSPIYIVPFVSLVECNHSFCVGCVKGLHRGRQKFVRCPTCRHECSKLRLISVNENNVFSIEFTANAISRMSTSTSSMNLKMLVESLYPFNLSSQRSQDLFTQTAAATTTTTTTSTAATTAACSQHSPSILATDVPVIIDLSREHDNRQLPNNQLSVNAPNDDDETFEARIVAVTELSRLQHEIDLLNSENSSALDLSMQIERNITQLNGQVENLNGQVENLNGQVESLNGQVGSLNQQVSNLNDEISRLNNDVSEMNDKVSELEEHMVDLNNHIEIKKRSVDILNKKVKLKESIVNTKEDRLNLLNQQIKNKENDLAKLNSNVAQEESKIVKLKRKQAELGSEIKKNTFLEQANKKLLVDLQKLTADYQDLHKYQHRFMGNMTTTINTIKTFNNDKSSVTDKPSNKNAPSKEKSIATSKVFSTAPSTSICSDTAASNAISDIRLGEKRKIKIEPEEEKQNITTTMEPAEKFKKTLVDKLKM
ncbi:cp30 [Agrotis segetum nucleopolyhedrovirus B]|uniref:Cp30 n=1 Tax=Agrotis segetum nucleopolyhedrovirus B TaxID=1580580 RepID=A0A0A7KVC4_9ABAC|nr:cp30 [Agrotis segetum nucleopolyhedrovirus B]AIZ48640.1 cp30 [Agrotis segetum nucleopolyhedrovirus B]